MKRIAIFGVFFGIVFAFSIAFAVPAGTIIEKDPGSTADAPDSANFSQDAFVLQPGRYGTTQVGATYESPLFSKKGDKDTYKLSVYPGVQFKFKVTPHNGQDIALQLLNSNGQTIPPPFFWMDADYLTEWDKGAAGFAEELIYIKGLNLSHTEDGLETLYLQVYDRRFAALLPADYGKERYTIDYEEVNVPDGQWTVDAPKHVLRAPLIEWDQIYEGYLGYLDNQDCYQFDPRPAVGRKVTVTAKPLDPELDIDIAINRSFYDADGSLMTAFDGFGNYEVKVGTRLYTSNNERIKEFHEGGPGFANSLTVYPYYAKGTLVTINSDFVYVCPELRKGKGRYEFSVKYEDVASAAPPSDEDKRNLKYPPVALGVPTASTIRAKQFVDFPFLGDSLETAVPPADEVAPPPPADEPAGGVIDLALERTKDYKLGAKIPGNLRDRALEKTVYDIFKKIYGRKPRMARRWDRIFVQAVAYQLEPKVENIEKEETAALNFEKIFGREPNEGDDWAIVQAMAYTRLRVKIKVK